MDDLLKDFKFTYDMEVAWGEMDAFAHVNNIYFFRYFENARIRYFEQMSMFGPNSQGFGPILASTKCKYIRPIVFPEKLRVGAKVKEISGDRFTMEYLILGLGSETQKKELKATGVAVVVAYDHHKKNKIQIPPGWLKEIERIEGRTFTTNA